MRFVYFLVLSIMSFSSVSFASNSFIGDDVKFAASALMEFKTAVEPSEVSEARQSSGRGSCAQMGTGARMGMNLSLQNDDSQLDTTSGMGQNQEENIFIVGRVSSEWKKQFQFPVFDAYINWFNNSNAPVRVETVYDFFINSAEGKIYSIYERIPRTNEIEKVDLAIDSEIWVRIYDMINSYVKSPM